MGYQTIMVHLQLGSSNAQVEHSNAAVLHATKHIAQRCNASVIGIAVGQQTQIIYGEGYALYCESLGKELGLYTNPYQYFGRLGMEMHRAIRLVVDVGIHTKGWTREQAIQYDLENESDSEDGITAEVERYMAIPGQALSYKTGELKIQELKKKAIAEMGDKMDIRKFHAELLKDGCVPLNILEEKINRFILQK